MAKQVPTSRLARGTKLGAVAAGSMVRKQRARLSMRGRSEAVRARMAEESILRSTEQLVMVLGTMKGVAMKLGQMMSVLDLDLVPPEHRERFQKRLAVLRNAAPSVSFEAMRAVIEEDYGQPLDAAFAEFEPEAIAAASIGQVYLARLHDGRQVAVKVQYPGIDAAVRADLKNLSMFRRVLQSAMPWVTPAVLDELRLNMEAELDYHIEAETQRDIAALYADHPFVVVPRPVLEHSTRRVLVTEYLGGTAFEDVRRMPPAERDRVGEIIYRFYVGSLFNFNEFCGDPHPGNVLLAEDGRVGFLDFGLYNRMDPEHVRFEAICLCAAAEDRGADLRDLMIQRGVIDSTDEIGVDECLEYVLSASEWCLVDQELTITPELASGAFLLAVDPRSSEFSGMKQQNLPPEHLFSRRADFLTFGMLGQLEATANWHRIAREWLYGEEPATELGRLHREWLDERRPAKRGRRRSG
ncbi:ABC1 kinase family protein [Nocardia sp. NBC_00416]|uniref:ABC1 kinase family protein n=1 Tax=Nocardia sp. NBC_00416 TaxID=2975991 RepID=UPI002E2355D1